MITHAEYTKKPKRKIAKEGGKKAIQFNNEIKCTFVLFHSIYAW